MSTKRDTADRRTALRTAMRLGLPLLGVLAVVITLRGHLPSPGAIWAILRTADPRWFAAALVAQAVSQAAFAFQQRHLLRAAGVDISPGAALSITYSRSAISMALPAGSAMSAAFAVQQYRRRGATGSTAATVTALSLIASMAGLLLLCAAAFGPAAVASWWHTASYEAVTAAAVLIAALTTAICSHPWTVRRTHPPAGEEPPRNEHDRTAPGTMHRIGRARTAAGMMHRIGRECTAMLAAARSIRPGDGLTAVLWSALNWAADAFCLIAAAHACALPTSWRTVAAAYLIAQVVRQIPLSPGGLGFVEASLVTALSLGGAPAAATAAVLGYRLISFWLLIPIGATTYLFLRRTPPPPLDLPNLARQPDLVA